MTMRGLDKLDCCVPCSGRKGKSEAVGSASQESWSSSRLGERRASRTCMTSLTERSPVGLIFQCSARASLVGTIWKGTC